MVYRFKINLLFILWWYYFYWFYSLLQSFPINAFLLMMVLTFSILNISLFTTRVLVRHVYSNAKVALQSLILHALQEIVNHLTTTALLLNHANRVLCFVNNVKALLLFNALVAYNLTILTNISNNVNIVLMVLLHVKDRSATLALVLSISTVRDIYAENALITAHSALAPVIVQHVQMDIISTLQIYVTLVHLIIVNNV